MLADWESIVRTHGPMAFDTAWRLLGNVADAEDVVQDALMDAFRLHSQRTVANWGGLLRRLAVCRAIDRLRTRQSVQPFMDEPASAESDRPEAAATEREFAERLRWAISKLPDREAAVLSLRYLGEMTNTEIADTLGISAGAVGTSLCKARTKLREMLSVKTMTHRRAPRMKTDHEPNDNLQENARMRTVHEPNHDSSDELLDRAIQATLAQSAPHDVRQRVIETAAAWSHGSTPGHPQQRGRFALPVRLTTEHFATARTVRAVLSNFRGRGRLGLAAVAAFVATVAAMLWLSHPNESWAQVAEALRKKPWSLGKYTTPDGEVHKDWMSFSRDVSAHHHGDSVQFSDHRLNMTYEYNAKERTLTRHLNSEADKKKGAERWFEKVFQQISRGAEKLDFAAPGVELVEQKRGTIAKRGQTWLSYELAIRVVDADVVDQKPVVRLTFLVDPQTRLPHYLVMSDSSMNPSSIEMELSYPETGPIDIYDLGVPRDAKLVDRVPTDDIRRVISEIKSSAERFEEHLALNVMSDAGSPWYVGTPFAVWRKGTSYRMVYGLVDAASAPPKTPKPDADQRQWWKRHWTELFQVPHEICDGSTLWNNEGLPAGWSDQPNKPNPITWRRATWPQPKWKSRPERHPWPAGSSPLFVAYPQNLVNYRAFRWEPVLDLKPADAPANTVKVILRTGATGSSSGEERYWIDTQRSHMVVRYESVTWDATNSPPVEVVNLTQVVETADRSPQGIWYPTLIRHISVTEQTGVKKTIETITRHYLDFEVKFTDDLFRPAERPGEPLE